MVFICKIISRNFNLYYYHFILLHFLGATAAALRFGQPSLVFEEVFSFMMCSSARPSGRCLRTFMVCLAVSEGFILLFSLFPFAGMKPSSTTLQTIK